MVKTLLTLLTAGRVVLAELIGAALVVYGCALIATPLAFVVGGAAVLAKSIEWDLGSPPTGGTPRGDDTR